MNFVGKRETDLETMKKNEKESVENNEKVMMDDEQPTKINYRGWKVMPFIIGKQKACIYSCTFYLIPCYSHYQLFSFHFLT